MHIVVDLEDALCVSLSLLALPVWLLDQFGLRMAEKCISQEYAMFE